MAPLGANAAQKLAKRFTHRANDCFAQVIAATGGRKLTPTERQDSARRGLALVRMDTELRSCLTGSGYGGEAMASEAMVKQWLAAGDCAGFARAAFTSRACFALSGVLDQMGYPAARPRSRPAFSSQSTSAGPTCSAPEPPTAKGQLAASHILIFYQGARRAPNSVTRTKAAARLLANRIATLARAPGASFAALAKRWSEGPSAPRGGSLGRFLPTRMVPPFSRAVARLCIGTVSGPVETPFGFHVIRRDQP